MSKSATINKTLANFAFLHERDVAIRMNETEFENFYHEHVRPLWAYVRRLADSAEVADDVTQESFLKFLGATIRRDENKKAYLYRIATNLTHDHFRRHRREIKHQSAINANSYEELSYEPFATGNNLTAVFDKLKMQERALLWLAYVEGYDHREIAETLGLKSLSVRVLLFRAKRKLTGLLDANNFEVEKL